MIAYKLCRKKKNGSITPLFINKKTVLPFNVWLEAECHPTKGFKVRPYWHCTSQPEVSHLTLKGRVWVKVEIEDYFDFERPKNQGGLWFLAKKIKLLEKYENDNSFDIDIEIYNSKPIDKKSTDYKLKMYKVDDIVDSISRIIENNNND